VIQTRHTHSGSSDATEGVGHTLAESLFAGDVVLLEGDLAAGKTTFVRGLLRGLSGNPDAVSSPSFVLIQSYECSSESIRSLHHVDLYRLGAQVSELRELGLSEVLSDAHAVVAVEWPKDTLATWIPTDARVWRVAITIEDDDARSIAITPPEG